MVARAAAVFALAAVSAPAPAQEGGSFLWNNPLPADAPEGVRHGTFVSKANGGVEIGYNILLPPGYDDPANARRRYPVVYYLHGGRPGGEHKSVALAAHIGRQLRGGAAPVIYVFVNGGRLSHYDHQGSLGETAFVEELIPHIDKTYRTIARREARGVEGFSQGGRGAARILFKHRDRFVSAAPMGGGHQHEKRIDENDGVESETVRISPPWNNTWELARRYAADKKGKPVRILVVVGTKDFNYEANLEWMSHLTALGIAHERIVVADAPHSAREVYDKHAAEIVRFHAANFRTALGRDW